MITIQDVGKEILTHTPRQFYVFAGCEYGIKLRYISELEKYYGNIQQIDTVNSVLDMMRSKHLIPLQPTVYVVRYDEEFVSSLDEKSAARIKSTKIIGTIVCIYEQSKHVAKLDKYLPNHVVVIDPVNPRYLVQYLTKDYPELDDRYIKTAVKISSDYNQAKNICNCMSLLGNQQLLSHTTSEIETLFGFNNLASEDLLKRCILFKDFGKAAHVLSIYDESADSILYTILSCMLELDKVFSSKYVPEDAKKYINLWNCEDVYNMFNHTYEELKRIRSLSYSDGYNSVYYLLGLLAFDRVPSLEAMQ